MIETQIDIKLSCAFPSFSSPNSLFFFFRYRLGVNKKLSLYKKKKKDREKARGWGVIKKTERSGECTEGGSEQTVYDGWRRRFCFDWRGKKSHLQFKLSDARSSLNHLRAAAHWNLILKPYFNNLTESIISHHEASSDAATQAFMGKFMYFHRLFSNILMNFNITYKLQTYSGFIIMFF